MIVVDASVIVSGLVDHGAEGTRIRNRLRGEQLTAPQLIDLEVTSAWRRLCAAGHLDDDQATAAIEDLRELRLRRAPHRALLGRCWELRHNLTTYDAAYVALAETLRIPLLTGDARIARAPGLRCAVELV